MPSIVKLDSITIAFGSLHAQLFPMTSLHDMMLSQLGGVTTKETWLQNKGRSLKAECVKITSLRWQCVPEILCTAPLTPPLLHLMVVETGSLNIFKVVVDK